MAVYIGTYRCLSNDINVICLFKFPLKKGYGERERPSSCYLDGLNDSPINNERTGFPSRKFRNRRIESTNIFFLMKVKFCQHISMYIFCTSGHLLLRASAWPPSLRIGCWITSLFSLSFFFPLHSSDWLPYLHPSKRRRRAKESHLYTMICWASDPHFWLRLSLLDGKWSGFLYTLSRKRADGNHLFPSSGIHLFVVIKNWITRRLAERIRRAVAAAAQEAALWHPEWNSLA